MPQGEVDLWAALYLARAYARRAVIGLKERSIAATLSGMPHKLTELRGYRARCSCGWTYAAQGDERPSRVMNMLLDAYGIHRRASRSDET